MAPNWHVNHTFLRRKTEFIGGLLVEYVEGTDYLHYWAFYCTGEYILIHLLPAIIGILIACMFLHSLKHVDKLLLRDLKNS